MGAASVRKNERFAFHVPCPKARRCALNALILEGSKSKKMPGWRNLLIMMRSGGGFKTATCIGSRESGLKLAEGMHSIFYTCGTWELNGESCSESHFPAPTPEIFSQLFGGKVAAMPEGAMRAASLSMSHNSDKTIF